MYETIIHIMTVKDDKYQGYIIISATKERDPILQYSIGEMGYDIDQSNKDEKIYYLGATNYLTAKNKENLKEKFIINKNKQIEAIEQEALKNKKE